MIIIIIIINIVLSIIVKKCRECKAGVGIFTAYKYSYKIIYIINPNCLYINIYMTFTLIVYISTYQTSPKEFWSQIYVFFVLKFMLYPPCVHRISKVGSILYQKFALWTYSPFRHEVSLLYFSQNNLLRVLIYVCRHCNIKCF